MLPEGRNQVFGSANSLPDTVSCNMVTPRWTSHSKNTCREVVNVLFQCSICLPGEGFHNYHHTFPYDYSASEFGLNFNPTTWFIDIMCWLGLATDRKRATKPVIEARKARTGDGSAWTGSRHPIRPLLTLGFMPSVIIVLLSIGSWERVQGGRDWHLCSVGIFCLSQSQDTTINEKKVFYY